MNVIYIIYSLTLLPLSFYLLRKYFRKVIARAKEDISYRNDLLAFSYLIKDLGPNTAAFSVVSLFTTQTEATPTLLLIAMIGICLHYAGRKIRDMIYRITENKSKQKKFIFGIRK